MRFDISFIVPCYNCEKQIISNINKLVNIIKNQNLNYEIITIDDGSYDNTFGKLLLLKKKFNFVKVLRNKKNIGKSFSLILGIKKSRYKHLIIIDCDLPYINSLKEIIEGLKKNNDLVIINRKIKGSKMVGFNLMPYQILRHIIGSIIAYLNIKILKIGVHGGDTQAGLKGFKKFKNFDKINFISKKFFFDLELVHLYSKRKLKVLSIKTKYSISTSSAISLFDFSKNFSILTEYVKVIKKYSKKI